MAEVGGAVAVGGSNTDTQLLFQGAPFIKNNIIDDGENGIRCNVYLNYDTNSIIRTSKTALSEGAYIGVYVASEEFDQHGDYEMLFGTFNNSANLAAFFNDRIYAGGTQGPDGKIKWTEFVCKITDADGNLLYIDSTCEAPAVYTTLENDGAANTSSAFGMLSNNTVNLYNANGRYSGAYQIQMLVENYTCVYRMSLPAGKTITLTTAEKDAEDGFPFTGAGELATIFRGGTFNNSWITNRADLTLKDVTMDGQNKESNDGANNSGGIICNKDSGILRIKTNATLRNSGTKTAGGGAVGLYGSTSKLYMEGGLIENCFAINSGGAVLVQNAGAEFYMSGGSIVNCSAKNGGAVYGTGKIYMSGGEITGNSATVEAGGIDLKNEIHFSGNPVISGNTLNGNPCNVHLINDNNTSIYADGLGPFADIRIYTSSGTIRNNHGVNGTPFGTWTNNENLHCFINDVNVNLRGMKTVGDNLIYWRTNPFLSVGKLVDSDWAADKDVAFNFKVTLDDDTYTANLENMDFVNGVATFTLKAGQVRTASGFPFEFIHNGVNYTVTETLAEGQTYTTTYSHNDGEAVTGTSVTGHFGENMSEDQSTSTSVSSVLFTNTRRTDDLTVSKTVTEGISSDYATPYSFTVTLKDTSISKTYNAKLFQDASDSTGAETTVRFDKGVGTFQLTHGQSMKILGLPTELGFKVEENLTEDQYANFRTYVTAGSANEVLSYSTEGKIGELKNVAFRNNRYGLVCKIVNDTVGREQLYYRENNNDKADPTPAIFDELEKAFEAISGGISFFTADGSSADVKLRIEMVKPHYEMKRQVTLASGYNVTLGTALKTDRLYPYPTDADGFAVVTRGFEGSSMIVDNGNLTLDNITLDGGRDTYAANENGGIVRVNGEQTLTVTANATLRNSATSGNGGAIWSGKKAALTMNGSVANCEAANGGGVYAAEGFGGGATGTAGIAIEGTIFGCTANAGNGGALYVNEAANIVGGAPVVLAGSAVLSGNHAVSKENENNSGRGGAIYCETDVSINSDSVTISGNTARKDGGAIYQSSESSFTMTGGTIRDNAAETGNAGGIWTNHIAITGGTFSGNKANDAENGKGGAIYTKSSSEVTITGTTFNNNEAYQGGAVYHQAKSFTMTNATMTGNSAVKNGGAVYVASVENGTVKTGSFDMNGGTISGNSSPEGAISTGSNAVLNFSGNASVIGNTAADGATAMNVYLGYHSNTIIHASGLTGTGMIGVYVKDGDDKATYYNHGIANRPFGTGSGEKLGKFVNDRDNKLTGVQGPDSLIMWPGKDLVIQVYQNKANAQGQKTTPVGGAKFTLATVKTDDAESVTLWTGESNPATSLNPGLITIPWGTSETENGNRATFTNQDENGNVVGVTYILSQQQANADTVLPAGAWRLTIGADNAVTWQVIPPAADPEQTEPAKVNRTLAVEPNDGATIGDTFTLYDDVKPTITFDPNGGILSGKEDSGTRTDTINFGLAETSHTYTIGEHNPTQENAVFRTWSTVKTPVEGDSHREYKQGDELLFYRGTDDDDVTLYALWSKVVCKITDRNDNLLYVNGSPAVYMSLKEGFDAFNEASFTLKDGATRATPRKIKMLVSEYEMTETVELARGKIAEFMTASNKDQDGYKGPDKTCVITRAKSFDSGSMIVDNYNLVLRDIILDGAVKDSSGTVTMIDGNGCIAKVTGNASHLTLAQGAVLRNATVNGNGGAIYAGENTIVTVSDGSITGCVAQNGGAIYSDTSGTVNLNGGTISDNTTDAEGGAVYAKGKVNLTGGEVKGNSAQTNGGALYLAEKAELTVTGGSVTANMAANGGGVYSDGGVTLENAAAVIGGNTASAKGGGVYIGENGSLTLSAGSIGARNSGNTAANGSGVYLAGQASLTGGSISYNGTAGSGNGGGLYIAGKTDIALNGTTLSNNTAANGGAVYAAGVADETETLLTLAKGTVSNNTASGNGGGVYLEANVAFEMTDGTLDGNTAQYGGGAYVASDSDMKLTDGTLSQNSATSGAAVYVEGTGAEAFGVLNMQGGSIVSNSADSFGGAVYLKGHGRLHISGGTVSHNSAKDNNGGAINAEGADARIYLSGKPTIFNNPDNAATNSQKNLVLSVGQNNIINTEESGLDQKQTGGTLLRAAQNVEGIVGVFVIDAGNVYADHGVYDKPFGTFAITDENRENAKNLVNDRNLALYGVAKENNIIYWKDVVCKVTDDKDAMLYQRVNVGDSGVYVYAPAIYTSLKDGLAAVSGNLYRKSGSRYATANTGAVKVKMLKDYALDDTEIITYNTARNVTLTTAETAVSSAMRNNGDTYAFVAGSDAARATLTRGQGVDSMFKVNTENAFNVSNLIIDGGSKDKLTTEDINGGAFDFEAVGTATFTNVTLKNLNATGNGGAIYLKAGTVSLTSGEIEDCTATNGGAVYVDGGTFNMNGGAIRGCEATSGGAIYSKGTLLLEGTAQIGEESRSNVAVNGGGLYVDGGQSTVRGSAKLQYNVANGTETEDATAYHGGGIYLASGALNIAANAEISHNEAGRCGGALYIANGAEDAPVTAVLSGGKLTGNQAQHGGGVYVGVNSALNLSGSAEISGNSVTEQANGGGVYIAGETIRSEGADEDEEAEAIVKSGAVHIRGGVKITDNTAASDDEEEAKASNLALYGDASLVVDGDLTTAAAIGICTEKEADIDQIGTENGVKKNLNRITYDLDPAIFATAFGTEKVVWNFQPVCKLTDGSDKLLFRNANLEPAVYMTLAEGFEAAGTGLVQRTGGAYAVTEPVKVKLLKDYALGKLSDEPEAYEIITYDTKRDMTLTTAETAVSSAMRNNGDTYAFVAGSDAARATLTRGQGVDSMFKVNTENAFNVSNLIIDGGSKDKLTTEDINGGAFNIEAVAPSTFSNVTLENLNATGNGGAIYLKAGTLGLTGSEIDGCTAKNGGAVYVYAGATLGMEDAVNGNTINGNTATADGAGIYLAEGSTLNLSGKLSFGGKGRKGTDPDTEIITQDEAEDGKPVGNLVNGDLTGRTNGQQVYKQYRQDIYMKGHLGAVESGDPKPATAIVVTGPISAETGSVWVAAEKPEEENENNHYYMLRQFAVVKAGATVNEATMQVFRNAWDDESTGCGADYLTGQDGDDLKDADGNTWKCIYWTGGFDFAFRKIDGNGTPMNGATFTLYTAVANGGKLAPIQKNTKNTPVDDPDALALTDWSAYQQPDKKTKVKGDATATSATIAAEDAVTIKAYTGESTKPGEPAVYGEGMVVFEKIPPGNYFLVETAKPENWRTRFDLYRVYVDGAGWISISGIDKDAEGYYEWPTATDPTAPATEPNTQLLKGADGKYSWAGTIPDDADAVRVFNIMNISELNRQVILRKVADTTYESLKDAEFDLLWADMTPYTEGLPAGKLHYVSRPSGVFFIGNLPYGTYYLHEVEVPDGYEKLDEDNDNWFVLTVNENGVGYKQGENINPWLSPETAKPVNN